LGALIGARRSSSSSSSSYFLPRATIRFFLFCDAMRDGDRQVFEKKG
jgi:hypothetical protein